MFNPLDYLQIPYVWDGRSFEGADCYGLIILYFKKELGVDLQDYKHGIENYEKVKQTSVYLDNAYREFKPVEFENMKRHDILLITNNDEGVADHAGVYIGNGRFLHALESCGCVISKLATWKRKIHSIFRYKGIT